MKHLKHILAVIALVFITFVAAACSNKGVKGISCDAAITARRDKITVVANFVDSDKRIFNTITPTVSLYKNENNKVGEIIESRTLSIKPNTDYAETTTSDEAVFNNLEQEKDYTVKVLVTVDGYESVLYEENVKTTLDGSDEEHAISIKTVDDFIAIKHDREGYFRLDQDLDFNNQQLSSMFYLNTSAFTGQFDGNNHTIKNFTMKASQQYNGLFGYNDGVIKNLTIENFTLTANRSSEAHIGFIAGYNEGQILNCNIKNSKLEAESTTYSLTNPFNVGGIVGTLGGEKEKIKVENCSIFNSEMKVKLVNNGSVGGAIGSVEGASSARSTQTITKNNVNMNVTVEQAFATSIKPEETSFSIGGFVGEAAGKYEDNISKGKIVVTTKSHDQYNESNGNKAIMLYVGGFAGRTIPNTSLHITNVLFDGEISVTSSLIYTKSEKATEGENNEKKVNFDLFVGGLIGHNSALNISNAAAKVAKIKVVINRENITGDHKVNQGMLFGTSTRDLVLVDKNIKSLIDVTFNVTLNGATKVEDKHNNVNNSLEGFSDFIKNNFK